MTVPWFVEDSGADSLAITMELMSLLPLTSEYAAIGWVQPLDPAQFTLDSGQSEDVQVTMDISRRDRA